MINKKLLVIFSIIFILILPLLLKSPAHALADHVVISEIQIEGATSKDEFVELYNPTDSVVDLTDWRLTRKTASGSESNLVSSLTGSISPHGYFLIANPEYDGTVVQDINYSAASNNIADDNSVVLYSDAGITVVDKVGMGSVVDFETSPTNSPVTDASIERKAFSSSTPESMEPGGADENSGNGEDTNNNSADFIERTSSDPQNTNSSPETPTIPSPTPNLSPSPTPEPTPTVSPTPTPTPEPTPTPSLNKKFIGAFIFPGRSKVCYLHYQPRYFGIFSAFFPKIVCEKI